MPLVCNPPARHGLVDTERFGINEHGGRAANFLVAMDPCVIGAALDTSSVKIIAGAVLAAIGFAWNVALVIFGVAITEWIWGLF